jgi:hypothetical protein
MWKPDRSEAPSRRLVWAPYDAFRRGIDGQNGYSVEEDGDHLVITFQPWFTESDKPWAEPSIRIEFRKIEEDVVLERFVVEEDGEFRAVDIDAAQDALQSWLNYACS